MAMEKYVLFTIVVLMIATNEGEMYNLTTMEAGIYMEKLGPLWRESKKIDIFFKLNLSELNDDVKNLDVIRNRIGKYCEREMTAMERYCDHFLMLSKSVMENLEAKLDNLLVERRARGLVDGIGSVGRFLFGSMDAKDRESIGEKFEAMQATSSKQEKINFQLTSIVEKSLTEMKAYATACNANGKLINVIGDRLNGISQIVERDSWAIQTIAFMNDLQTTFIILSREIEDKIRNVHETLREFHNNMFSTKLISFKDIIKELRNFQVPDKDSILPIDVKEPDLEILRKITKYAVVVAKDQLYVVFSIPTLNREKLMLTKTYAIPKTEDNHATFIVLPDDYLTWNEHHEKIASLSTEEFKDCKVIKGNYYCENLNTFNKAKDSCIHSIFYGDFEFISKNCETKTVRLTETLIRKTSSRNKYLITNTKETFGKLAMEKGPQRLRFLGTQLLEVNENARLYVNDKEIDFYTKSEKIETEFSLIVNFPNVTDLEQEKLRFENISKVQLIKNDNQIATEIETLKKTLLENPKVNKKIDVGILCGIIILVVIIIIFITIAFYLVKIKKKVKNVLRVDGIERGESNVAIRRNSI